MRKIWLSTLFLLLVVVGFAHEFWLAPQKYSWQAGEKVYLRWQVGENFTGANWTGSNDKVRQLRAFSNIYSFDLIPFMSSNSGDSVRLDTLKYAGNFTIAYQGHNSFIEMDGAAFNAYLLEDSLTNALEYRQDNHLDTTKGREYYQRSAKTLVRIKSTLKKSDYMKNSFVASPTGLMLDIVPLDNPYNLTQPTTMQFNIYYQGRLRDGVASVWHKVNGKTEVKKVPVVKGLLETTIDPTGEWMISMVKMEPSKVDTKADWQSYWGSLTWGY